MAAVSRVLIAIGIAPVLASHAQTSSPATSILAANCSGCHGASTQMSGLQLSSRQAALKGGTRGAALVPGNSRASLVYRFISHSAEPHMPPGKALSKEDVQVIGKWIDAGAEWPEVEITQAAPAGPQWWSFWKPVRPPVPKIEDAWVRNPVDAFVLAKLRERKFHPSPEASRAELIRRATFDLHGLPPTAEEVQAFLNDPAPGAYEKLIDRLLASPRYGEKWGRQWLDLVRYADTAGFEIDAYNSDAWRYRDWVIDSLNKDTPYDKFVAEQLAGDEIAPEDPQAQIGTGYFCVGPNMDIYPDQQDINRVQTLTDYVDTTSAVYLGLTVSCARCHDHKFDPIPQRDYYRMQAIFEPAVKAPIFLTKLGGLGWRVSENTREIKLQELSDEIRAIEQPCREKLPKAKDDELRACLSQADTERLQGIERQLTGMFANYKPKPAACGVREMSSAYPKTYIPGRGGGNGPAVMPGFLSALGGGEIPTPDDTALTTGRRKALAQWIASPENPLTARVAVNRIWQGHFGRGLVATPSDFGTRGAKPSHPELLDWLAKEFVTNGWSMKQMHKLLMLSSTYRQGANPSPEAAQLDPENVMLSHANRRRLAAEEVRDAVLQVSGSLNLEMFGRPVTPHLADRELFGLTGTTEEKWIVTEDPKAANRRSVYLFVRRTYRVPMLEVFDSPEGVMTCPRRESSTTSTQSLTLLNSDFVVKQARALAARLTASTPDDAQLVSGLWRAALARDPTNGERREALLFLQQQTANAGSRERAAGELARALFNLNEFLYVD